jgi:hypothetical protein
MSSNKFHEHLDQCQRCASQPFNLCYAGAALLREALMRSGNEERPRCSDCGQRPIEVWSPYSRYCYRCGEKAAVDVDAQWVDASDGIEKELVLLAVFHRDGGGLTPRALQWLLARTGQSRLPRVAAVAGRCDLNGHDWSDHDPEGPAPLCKVCGAPMPHAQGLAAEENTWWADRAMRLLCVHHRLPHHTLRVGFGAHGGSVVIVGDMMAPTLGEGETLGLALEHALSRLTNDELTSAAIRGGIKLERAAAAAHATPVMSNEAEAKARRAIRIGNILGKVKPKTWAHLQQSVTLEEVLLMGEVLAVTDLDAEHEGHRSAAARWPNRKGSSRS